MKKFLVLLFLGAIFMNSCDKKKVSDASKEGEIILIFNKMPENWRFQLDGESFIYKASWGKNEVGYVRDKFIPFFFFPDSTKQYDTLVIKDVASPIEIMHKYNGFEELSFIAYPQDTLLFNYEGRVPIVSSSRNSARQHDYDYESIVKRTLHNGELSGFVKFQMNPIGLMTVAERKDFFAKDKSSGRRAIKTIDSMFKEKHFRIAKNQLAKEMKLLDSLLSKNKISKDIAEFYRKRIACRQKYLTESVGVFLSFENISQQDSLLKYSFYRNFIEKVALSSMEEQVKIATGSYSRAKKVYAKIQESPHLKEGTRAFLSFLWMEKIIQNSKNEEMRKYFKIYRSNYSKDSLLIDHLMKKYSLKDSVSNEVELENEMGETTSWSELLAKHKGKVLYVDFWASWCAPCKKMLPFSHQLSEKYKNEEIIFIYLALNDSKTSWLQTLPKVQLSGSRNSFLITNPKNSNLIDEWNILSIPRYMVFDKEGKLVDANAPRPNDGKIETILDKYLAQ